MSLFRFQYDTSILARKKQMAKKWSIWLKKIGNVVSIYFVNKC